MTAAQRPEPLDLAPIEARLRDLESVVPAPDTLRRLARWDVPALLAEVRRLREQLDRVRVVADEIAAETPKPGPGGYYADAIREALDDGAKARRPAMTAAEAYRDAQQRVEAVAAQHLAPTSTRLARVVPVDAVEALAARLGLLADATEIVPEVPR